MRPLGLLSPLLPRHRPHPLPMIGVLVTLGIAVLCGLVLLADRREDARRADRAAANIATAVAQDITRTITLYDLSLQAVAHGLDLPGLWQLTGELRQMVLFDRTAAAVPFGFLNVLNEAGDVIADLQAPTPRPANFAGRDYFQAVRRDPQDQLFIGHPVLTSPGQPATVPLARRRTHPDGSFAGVVVGSMRLAYVQQAFTSLDLGVHGSIALMRTDGVILMRLPFNPDDIGRTMPHGAPLFRFLATGTPDIETVDPDRIARTTALHRVGELPLVVSVGLADQDIYQGWWIKAGGLLAVLLALGALDVALVRAFRRAAVEQARAEAAVHHAEAEKARIITTVSHELRTPLTSVLGYAEMLSDMPGLQPEQAGQLAALTSAGTHLRMVIDRLIDFTHSDLLLSAPHPEPTNPDLLVAQCRVLMQPEAARQGLVLTCQVDADLPRCLNLDPNQLKQVLGNLISNAVKYTERGSVTLTLSGTAIRLRCEVADTGPGVPPAKRARLFRAFDRLDTERNVSGWGIGLSIAAGLVRRMNGVIGYQDNPGGGSLFWLEIPVTEATVPPAEAAPAMAASGKRLRILLAEDDATNRDVATTFLRAAGHQVTTAANGAEALHIAASEDFDIVVTDMRMPRMNGLETARRIRGLDGLRSRTPILLLTADMHVTRQAGYDEAQISLLMPKPYNAGELLAAVQAATGAPRPGPAVREGLPLLDEAQLSQLAAGMSADNVEAHLRTLSGRICDLIALLRHPDERDAEGLADLVHDTVGAAGLLGFRALSTALQRYQHLEADDLGERSEATATLVAVAEASLTVLRRRLPCVPNHVSIAAP
ncbi:MAG: ATP-binding protein [Acetobacteraceae bacterium]|nr:ATP-binding protein [Acetobacteraceae bacterium]